MVERRCYVLAMLSIEFKPLMPCKIKIHGGQDSDCNKTGRIDKQSETQRMQRKQVWSCGLLPQQRSCGCTGGT